MEDGSIGLEKESTGQEEGGRKKGKEEMGRERERSKETQRDKAWEEKQ